MPERMRDRDRDLEDAETRKETEEVKLPQETNGNVPIFWEKT